MAESSADIGASFDNYTGNSALGGANAQVFNIDTKPLELLGQYTFHYKKALWDQQQEDTNAKVKQLSDLSNIHLNDLRGHDKEQATKEFSDLLSYASDYARKIPANSQEKIQQELEWQTKLGAFNNNFDSGKQRAVSYYAHLNTIKQNVTDATTQDEAIKQLNKSFDDTSIDTPISAVPNFKVEKFDIPDPTPQKFNSVALLGNDNLDIAGTIYNPKLNAGVADATILDIGQAYPKKGTSEYDKLSPNEKDQADIQGTVSSSGKGWVDAVDPLNSAIKKYVKDGKFDADSFETDNASNITLMNAYNALKKYNSDNRDRYNQAVNGYFTDKGVNIPLPPNVNPDDFKVGFVDFSKGVNSNQLVQSGMYAKWKGDVFEKKITHTGDARAIQTERENRASMERINSANIAKDKYVANLPYEKQKKGALGADGQPIDFGNLIYGVNTSKPIDLYKVGGEKVSGLKINNGVMVDKSGNIYNYSGDVKVDAKNLDNSIVTEFNKYSGTTKMDKEGNVLSSPSTSKLTPDESGQFTVRMENGEIKGIKTDDGTFATSDQFQHITMESAQKGVSKYHKADTNLGKFQNSKNKQVDEYGVPLP